MSLDPPQYVLSLQNNIRARPISWEGAVRAKTISEADLKRIKSVDKVRKEQRRQTVESSLDEFITLFLGNNDSPSIFQQAAKRQDIVQYLLVLSGDIIEDIDPFVKRALSHPQPFAPFLPFLTASSNPEEPVPLLTSSVLSSLISQGLALASHAHSTLDNALRTLYTYLATLARSSDSGLREISVRQYSSLLRSTASRQLFWDLRQQTLTPLVEILRAAAGNPSAQPPAESTANSGAASIRSVTSDVGLSGGVSIQLLYHVLLVIWQLSFEATVVGPSLDTDYNIIPLFTHLLRVSPKEKITRLILATLNNLLSANTDLLPSATTARLPALLGNIKGKHITDEDLLTDLDNLKTVLEDYSKQQTTLSQYESELRSGHLRWSPPHRSAPFWKENAHAILERNKGELAQALANILAKDWEQDPQVLAIGCNDVAWLVKEVPEKKQMLEKLGLKARVMELMGSAEESVRWESLRAVGEWVRYSFDR